MVPALEVSPAAQSELPVSTAAPLKDRQTDRRCCLTGLASWGPYWLRFLSSPQQGCLRWDCPQPFILRFSQPFGSARHSTGPGCFYVQEVSRRFIFALSLGTWGQFSFMSTKQTTYQDDVQPPSPTHFSSFTKMGLVLNHRRKKILIPDPSGLVFTRKSKMPKENRSLWRMVREDSSWLAGWCVAGGPTNGIGSWIS